MQILGVIYLLVLFLLSALLTIGGYFVQRDRYWTRIWKELGKPDVKNIRELKIYIQNQPKCVPLKKAKDFDLNR